MKYTCIIGGNGFIGKYLASLLSAEGKKVKIIGIKALASEVDLDVEVCLFASLEAEEVQERYPDAILIQGRSYKYFVSPKKLDWIIRWNKIISKTPKFKHYLQIPIEVAYDTVSVLKKK